MDILKTKKYYDFILTLWPIKKKLNRLTQIFYSPSCKRYKLLTANSCDEKGNNIKKVDYTVK